MKRKFFVVVLITVFLAVFLSGLMDAANRKYQNIVTEQVVAGLSDFQNSKEKRFDVILKLMDKPEFADKARDLNEKLFRASIFTSIAKIFILVVLSIVTTRILVKKAVSITSHSSGPRDAAA